MACNDTKADVWTAAGAESLWRVVVVRLKVNPKMFVFKVEETVDLFQEESSSTGTSVTR